MLSFHIFLTFRIALTLSMICFSVNRFPVVVTKILSMSSCLKNSLTSEVRSLSILLKYSANIFSCANVNPALLLCIEPWKQKQYLQAVQLKCQLYAAIMNQCNNLSIHYIPKTKILKLSSSQENFSENRLMRQNVDWKTINDITNALFI